MTVAIMNESSTWQFIICQMKLWFCLLNDSAYYINNYISDCAFYVRIMYMTPTKMNAIDFLTLKKLVLRKMYQSCKVIEELRLARVVSYIILKPYRIEEWAYPDLSQWFVVGLMLVSPITLSLKERVTEGFTEETPFDLKRLGEAGLIWIMWVSEQLQKYKNSWYVQGRESCLIWL